MLIKVENTTDAAIFLPKSMDEPLAFPRAIKEKVEDKKTGESRIEMKYTPVEVEEDFINKLREGNKVVAAYFSKKMLRVVGSGPPPGTTTAAGGKGK